MSQSKAETYDQVTKEIHSVLEEETNLTAQMATISWPAASGF